MLISRLDIIEERISELENVSRETSQTEKQREQTLIKQNRMFKDCGITTKDITYS